MMMKQMNVKDMEEGNWTDGHRWIAFGQSGQKPILWRVLRVYTGTSKNKCAFLLAEDVVARMKFADKHSNDWDDSSIKKWLNGDFYNGAFSEKEQEAILTHKYTYGGKNDGGNKESSSKVFLLSTDEALDKRYFADDSDRDIDDVWWLRSPGHYDHEAAIVYRYGEVNGNGHYVDCEHAVDPALVINLESSIFASSPSEYKILYRVK
jgi:hypothetical protein